jgi:hypothetical protein
MRRIPVVLVLVLGATVWPATNGLAHGSAATNAASAGSLQADFNNDGFADLAVGTPFEDAGTIEDAGAVNVLYGSAAKLTGTGSQIFTQDSPGVDSAPEAGDNFGSALATGDFNQDGFADLAIGVPDEDFGAIQGGGAVNVLYGTPTGLTGTGSQIFTQDSPGVGSAAEDFEFFGSPLAVGDFNNDTFNDLAVGVVLEGVGAIEAGGAVNVLYGSAAKLTGVGSQIFTQNSAGGSAAEADDLFGDGLAAGDFNNDSFDDLAVGVGGEDVGSVVDGGAVNVLYGSAAKLTGVGGQLFTQNSPGVGSAAEEGDLFGLELTAGDFNDDGFADLAVGVPFESFGTTSFAGGVNVLYGSAANLTGVGSQLFNQNSPGVGSAAEALDFFGSALAAADFNNDGFADLAVGVPFEDVGAIRSVGAVNVLYGSAANLTGVGSQIFTQDSPGIGSAAEAFDEFGQPLAASGPQSATTSPASPTSHSEAQRTAPSR